MDKIKIIKKDSTSVLFLALGSDGEYGCVVCGGGGQGSCKRKEAPGVDENF